MNYQETIEYLYHSTPVFEHVGASAYKEGLDNTLALDEHYGHPHRLFKTVHIAGTNGKGSCSHTIASILQEAGYKVGLYTSPHLVDFRERIRVNGQCVSEEYVINFVANYIQWNDQTAKRLFPSFFELTTAMAFKYFADQQVDIAVIEVGLGGRLDCTNIITPILSVITNISFDHTGFLGDTLAKIAAEKAGIIKESIPVVIGEYTEETRPVFEAKAKEKHAPITFAQDLEELGKDIDFELKGDYQTKNKQTILTAISILAPSLSRPIAPACISNGIAHVVENTGLMGRWQVLQEHPKVVCDTGHNVGGWQYLSRQIQKQPCRKLRIVFGMVDDKDINTVMELLPKHAVYYWTQADNHRAIPADGVATFGRTHQLDGNIYNKVSGAYQAALHDAAPDDFIFVGGSSYIVADLLSSITKE
jgi:dihydrofolate synthase/folylpolyglutamate synthase